MTEEESGGDQAAFGEAENAVAAGGEVQVVRDEDGGEGLFAVELLQEGEDALGGGAVEVAGGLVG
jgi:hypothetical protein